MTGYRDPFLKHRKAQEKAHLARVGETVDPMASLISVEMNVTELCNRVCDFCPRVDPEIYPNRDLSMDLEVSRKVVSDLAGFGYGGRISFSGYGESLLNQQLSDHIRIFRTALPENFIETNTNGDKLTLALIQELFKAGFSALYVNLYDGPEQIDEFTELFAEAGIGQEHYKLRPHWPGSAEDFGLTLNNRAGIMENAEVGLVPLEQGLKGRCYYPFYKMFVDWNGDVLFCANDWARNIIVGNVMKNSVGEIWMSEKMRDTRLRLGRGDRGFNPCGKCDVVGTLHGQFSFDHLMSLYGESEGDESTPPKNEATG